MNAQALAQHQLRLGDASKMTFRLEYQDEGGKWIKLAKSYPSLADAKEQAEMKFFRHIPVKIIEERAGRPTEQPAAQASKQPTEEPLVAQQAEEVSKSSTSKQTHHHVFWTKEELNFVAMAVEERLAKVDCWPLEPRNHAETNKLGGFITIVMKAQEILDSPRQKSLKGIQRMLAEVRRVANKLHRARLKGGEKAKSPPDKKVTATCPVCFKEIHKKGLMNHMAWHNRHGKAVPAIPEAEPLGPPVSGGKQGDNMLARLVEKRVEELVEAAVQRVLKRILG